MQKVDSRKIALVVLFVLILVVIGMLAGKVTYSFLAPHLDDDKFVEGGVTATGDTLLFSKGEGINLTADVSTLGDNNLTSETSPSVKLTSEDETKKAKATYFVGFEINSNTFAYSVNENTPELILTVKDETGEIVKTSSDELQYVTSGSVSGFDITGKVGAFNIVSEKEISTLEGESEKIHTWTFTLTFINMPNVDQSINESAKIELNVILQKNRIYRNFVEYLKNEEENGLKYIAFKEDNTSNITNESYRFVGNNESVKNYVCFGYDDITKAYKENWCPEEYQYRVIGVIDGYVKLVKNTSVNELAWNSSEAVDGLSNVWKNTSLKGYLNTTYLNGFANSWQKKIATVGWNMPRVNHDILLESVPKALIGYDKSEIALDAKVGLMNITDYVLAANNVNEVKLSNYNQEEIKTNNWMYLSNQSDEWLINADDDANSIYYKNEEGSINHGSVTDLKAVRPVFYLEKKVTITGGSGTASDPYRID